ncbi:MAG: lipoyl(octanoyl) transferase LipB [Alphaproteobacteria bacterium]|nr:lipoyl(octanoyl) transferase LipB [Alphaproteobacteria bacterium]
MTGLADIDWRISDEPVPYPEALAAMEARVAAIHAGTAPELVWLLQHPPLYTAGTSARHTDLLMPDRFPVYPTGRGGQYTYHGPGQRVVYLMLDLRRRGIGVHRYVHRLEDWVIAALGRFNVRGERRADRIGVWVVRPDKPPLVAPDGTTRPAEDKIAAIGVRVRHWVAFHGVSINVDPDLSHFSGIVPCGIAEHGVTSLVDLGLPITMADLDAALRATFDEVFAAASAVAAGGDARLVTA